MPADLNLRFNGWRQQSHMQFQLSNGHVTVLVIPAIRYEEFNPETCIAIDNAIKTCMETITTAIQKMEQ